MSRWPQALAALAALVLVATAVFHGSGYSGVSESIGGSSASSFLKGVVPGLWLFFSWHLAALGLGALWAALRGGASMRALVWFAAAVVAVDTLWLLKLAGLFAGTALLALAAACLVTAALRWKGD